MVGFNEAAARCRGKRQFGALLVVELPGASMRPRPDAAENAARSSGVIAGCEWCFNEAAARCRGKHAALVAWLRRAAGFNEAAARCRGKLRRSRAFGLGLRASMRPRPDAAENTYNTIHKIPCQALLQ